MARGMTPLKHPLLWGFFQPIAQPFLSVNDANNVRSGTLTLGAIMSTHVPDFWILN